MAKVTFTIHKAGKHQRHSRRNQILDAAQRCFKKQGFHPENRGIYTQSDSSKKSSRNIWSLAVVSVDQRY